MNGDGALIRFQDNGLAAQMSRVDQVASSARHTQALADQRIWIAESAGRRQALGQLEYLQVSRLQDMPGGQVSRSRYQRDGIFGLHQDQREDENEGGDQDR